MVIAFIANDAESPLLIVFGVVRVPQPKILPVATAAPSPIKKSVTVPQLVVHTGKLIAVPLFFVVGVVPVALGQLVELLVTATLAYAVFTVVGSTTVIPVVASDIAEVAKPTYTVPLAVKAVAPQTKFNNLASRKSEKLPIYLFS